MASFFSRLFNYNVPKHNVPKQCIKSYIFDSEKEANSKRSIDEMKYSDLGSKDKQLYNIICELYSSTYNDTMDKTEVTISNDEELYDPLYKLIVLQIETPGQGIQYISYLIPDDFTIKLKGICYNKNVVFNKLIYMFDIIYGIKHITKIWLVKPKSSGGKKAVVKHTVKQLQAIASKNNIKITKKVDGKTVRLNKQGLIAKLKRYKLL